MIKFFQVVPISDKTWGIIATGDDEEIKISIDGIGDANTISKLGDLFSDMINGEDDYISYKEFKEIYDDVNHEKEQMIIAHKDMIACGMEKCLTKLKKLLKEDK